MTKPMHEVPRQVFDAFLTKLSAQGVPADTVERLRHTLLKQPKFTEAELAKALFPEDDA